MAPLPNKTIEYFTHPNHPLFEINNDIEYLCHGCKTLGSGKRFRCHGCDFDLHEYCGTCPMTLSSFMHSQHQLNLVRRQPQATRQNDRFCDVCDDSVEGIFYRCELCDFNVHPVCTQLPQQVRHLLHPAHPLTLQPFSSTWCLVCRNECTSWRYRCGICCVDIHLECPLTPCDESMTTSMSTPRSLSVGQPSALPSATPPGFGAYAWEVSRPSGIAYAPPPGFGAYAWEVPRPFGIAYASGVQAPPLGAYNNAYVGVPFGFIPSTMHHHHPQGNQQVGGGGRFRKKIYKLVGNLALGFITSGVTSSVSAALFGI